MLKTGSLSNIWAVLTKIQQNCCDSAPLIRFIMNIPACFTYFRASRDGFRTKSNRIEIDCVRFVR